MVTPEVDLRLAATSTLYINISPSFHCAVPGACQ